MLNPPPSAGPLIDVETVEGSMYMEKEDAKYKGCNQDVERNASSTTSGIP